MLNHTEIKALIIKQGILPLYFHEDAAVSVDVLKALYAAGIRVIEYTNRGDNALKNFKQLKEVCATSYKDMVLGVGTIKTGNAATAFINVGADFLISPCWSDEIFAVCNEKNYFWIPGCMTSTEIAYAEVKGISMVKLFPGSLLGPSYVQAMKDVFPAMQFMPTGGVDVSEENLGAWFKAGVAAVGLGSKVISKDLMEQKNYAAISQLAATALQIVQQVKQKK